MQCEHLLHAPAARPLFPDGLHLELGATISPCPLSHPRQGPSWQWQEKKRRHSCIEHGGPFCFTFRSCPDDWSSVWMLTSSFLATQSLLCTSPSVWVLGAVFFSNAQNALCLLAIVFLLLGWVVALCCECNYSQDLTPSPTLVFLVAMKWIQMRHTECGVEGRWGCLQNTRKHSQGWECLVPRHECA